MSKFRPLHDRLLVRRLEPEDRTKGGIFIPDSAQEKPVEGKVIAVGSGRVLEDGSIQKLGVQKGDRVLFGRYAGTEIEFNGTEHTILREDEVLGLYE